MRSLIIHLQIFPQDNFFIYRPSIQILNLNLFISNIYTWYALHTKYLFPNGFLTDICPTYLSINILIKLLLSYLLICYLYHRHSILFEIKTILFRFLKNYFIWRQACQESLLQDWNCHGRGIEPRKKFCFIVVFLREP